MIWDLHVHTNYCDGKHSPEQMVLAAMERGMDVIGLCTHSYTFFDEAYCIAKGNIRAFQDEVHALAKKYAADIRVLCGVEQDVLSAESTDGFDYVIGSAHYIPVHGKYIPVDESLAILQDAVQVHFDGDVYRLVESYYDLVGEGIAKLKPDVIGHFDLITKFNETNSLFDDTHPRYIAAYRRALDRLLLLERPFEVNTGAISRGYRTAPYPSGAILADIVSGGGRVCLSSDSHSQESLLCSFDRVLADLRALAIVPCDLPQ